MHTAFPAYLLALVAILALARSEDALSALGFRAGGDLCAGRSRPDPDGAVAFGVSAIYINANAGETVCPTNVGLHSSTLLQVLPAR